MPQGENSVQAQAIIETPKGSRSKFKFDVAASKFKLSKVLPEGMVFPYDFDGAPEAAHRVPKLNLGIRDDCTSWV